MGKWYITSKNTGNIAFVLFGETARNVHFKQLRSGALWLYWDMTIKEEKNASRNPIKIGSAPYGLP